MKRNITEKLIEWKNKQNRKPLLLTGVRQCGKTFILKEFGNSEFIKTHYFNFEGNTGLKSVFDYDFNIDRILDELSIAENGQLIVPGQHLVIFDEIQECPKAIQSLKYFCENKPSLHIVAAGSLLGVALKTHGMSFPVGKVDRLEMFPMSFDEFVCADGGENLLRGLAQFSKEREIPELFSTPFEKYLKNYYLVGGMPEVVQSWVNTHSYTEVEKLQNNILADYSDDFGKYADHSTTIKIKMIWDSIPIQIAKENNKFIFSHVKQGMRSKELEDALEWLVNSGLVYKLNMVTNPEIPLSAMADSTYFKVYFSDIGLLRKKANINCSTILESENSFRHFKGAMAENFVMSQLKTMGIESYFWRTKSDAEIDFLTDYNGKIVPIEVKSADNTKAKSLHLFCNRFNPQTAVKTSLKNVGDNYDGSTHVWSIPLYSLFRIKDYLL